MEHQHPSRPADVNITHRWTLSDPSYACFKPLMSIFSICSIACQTLSDFSASVSCNSSPKTEGMTCQDRPNLSVNQPHLCFSPPSESFSHSSSTSGCVSQFTKNDIAGVKVNSGPPLSAENSCPSSWNVADIPSPWVLALLRHSG